MVEDPSDCTKEWKERMEQLWAVVIDRLDVLEEHSCENYNTNTEHGERLDRLEDRVDKEL